MNEKRKKMILLILAVMVVVFAGIGGYYWYQSEYYVSTDDATVTGDLVAVSPQMSGKLVELNVEEGDTVVKGQIVGRQGIDNPSDTNIDETVLRAPINGIVIKKQATVGEIVSPGQTIAYLIDPTKLYVSANVEETKLGYVKAGQKVDLTIDQFGNKQFTGTVKYVGEAANSTFSLLPTSTSGTFTKVVQKIPVKIYLDKNDASILPGTNAVVHIHIK
ncbi:multidrug resistance efflux pump [Desulfosporosinus acidiphilus SJ4]|uniref:Multidrug resistance efflux pump n=1 Tax=Desulfosporosinus acidiphilus (strain DSM 22704 / JCM 16185 / SJ4) TaxID=646529 RepID=I4DBC5_DESAJ|nr:efflux RND transporter periplasmic adaptor subunit [Desulfosporosinus acidiphilus]AFM43099.1 multidrug resistance efflux pump [Desulfosporosinus acidiphilus SJ4]